MSKTSSLLLLLSACFLAKESVSVDYPIKIVRIQENKYYLDTILIDRDDTTTGNHTFYRYGLFSTSDYQVGVETLITSISKASGVVVYLRKYSSESARTVVNDNQKLNGIPDDYHFQVLTGAKSGELLDNTTIVSQVSNISYFSFPLQTVDNRCADQDFDGSTFLAIDIYIPEWLTEDITVKSRAELRIQIHWEDIRLAPPNPEFPLLRPAPILELPRTVIASLVTSPEGTTGGNGIDTDTCVNQVSVQVRFKRPIETYITHYWLYTTGLDDASQCSSSVMSSLPYAKLSVASLPLLATDPTTVQFNITNYRGIPSFPFCVVVFAANQAGRDLTGTKTVEIRDTVVTGSQSSCISGKFAADLESSYDPVAHSRMQLQQQQQGEDDDGEDVLEDSDYRPREEFESLVSEQVEGSRRIRKFTVVNSFDVTVPGMSSHNSLYTYARRIQGYLTPRSRFHMYKLNVSSMAAYSLNVTAQHTVVVNGTGNSTSLGIQAVVVVSANVLRCVREMTVAQIQQLAIDNSDVYYIPMDCSQASLLPTYAAAGITLRHSCTTTSNRTSGLNFFSIKQTCSTPSSTNMYHVFVMFRSNATVGVYNLDFGLTDYSVMSNYSVKTDLVLTGSTLSSLQRPAVQQSLIDLLASRTSTINSTFPLSVNPRPTLLSSSSLSFTYSFVVRTNQSDVSRIASTLLQSISVADVNNAISNGGGSASVTDLRVFTRPAVDVSGCIVPGTSRTFSVPYAAGCLHSFPDLVLISGSVRAMYLRADDIPTSIEYSGLSAYPDTRASTQHTCALSANPTSTAAGAWYGQLVLLDASTEVLGSTTYQAQLMLSTQNGYEQDLTSGWVCCDQLDHYTINLSERKRLRINVTVTLFPNQIRAVFVQKNSCPSGDISICTSANSCYYNASGSASGLYSILTPLSEVQTTATKWCVGIRALPKTTLAHHVSYEFSNVFDATPNPTPTPEPSVDLCRLNPFCDRTLISTSEASGRGWNVLSVAWMMALALVGVAIAW